MTLFVWILAVVLALALILMLVGKRAVGGVDPTTLSFDPGLINQVRALAATDQRIAAIKLLRQHTPGLGLAAAKLMVDRMAPAARPSSEIRAPEPSQQPFVENRSQDDLVPSASPMPLEVEMQARGLVSAGQKLQAIKLVRERTGYGLRDAKAYVEGL